MDRKGSGQTKGEMGRRTDGYGSHKGSSFIGRSRGYNPPKTKKKKDRKCQLSGKKRAKEDSKRSEALGGGRM